MKFSLPINPKMTPEFISNDFIPFLLKYRENIIDLYFTVYLPPFEQDAMGMFFNKEDIPNIVANALIISEETGIPVSPTFNNIHISPSYENLKLFINNFKPLYKMGIRRITIPFTSWMLFGDIKREFPDIYIKNTVLQQVKTPQQLFDLFDAGFDYINIDQSLVRSQKIIGKMYEVKQKCQKIKNKKLSLSILYNENCLGNCPIQFEHFLFNTQNDSKVPFFKSSMNCISCTQWEKEDDSYFLKTNSIIDTPEFMIGFNNIDVFKLHGRESMNVLANSMNIIKAYHEGYIVLDKIQQFKQQIDEDLFSSWISKIKDCGFECWDCNICDEILRKKQWQN